MISARMSRPPKLLVISCAVVALSVLASGCGTENIRVPKSAGAVYTGAVLFSQRCSGCHTFSYAATHGSASNVRAAEFNNGPNFDQRCERPLTRVLYAIENGGFSGAIMPQNVVVGQDAIDVAKFVATYSGRSAPKIPGSVQCQTQAIGTIPGPVQAAATTTTATTTPATTTPATTTPAKASSSPAKTKGGGKAKGKSTAKK
jgi:mono/diheme cytochrome c family protein